MRKETVRTSVCEFNRRYGEKTRMLIEKFFNIGLKLDIVAKVLKGGYNIDIRRQDIQYWEKRGVFNPKDPKLP